MAESNFENILFFHKKVFKNFLLLRIIPANIILISFHLCEHHLPPCNILRQRERQVHLFIFCLTLTYQTVFVYTVLLGSARSSSLLYFDASPVHNFCQISPIRLRDFTLFVLLNNALGGKWFQLHAEMEVFEKSFFINLDADM